MMHGFTPSSVLVVGVGYVLLLATSGVVVNAVISRISAEPISQKVGKEARDVGFVIGKCENLLVLTFMLLGDYTALAIIFAAKAIVRREDMSKNSIYFLAGTMVNVTYSLMVGMFIKLLLTVR